jgi:hypothetical protein
LKGEKNWISDLPISSKPKASSLDLTSPTSALIAYNFIYSHLDFGSLDFENWMGRLGTWQNSTIARMQGISSSC